MADAEFALNCYGFKVTHRYAILDRRNEFAKHANKLMKVDSLFQTTYQGEIVKVEEYTP